MFIVGYKRTPIGSLGGALAGHTAVELGATAVRAALESARVPAAAVQECYMGCVLSGNVGQGPARLIALCAGLPPTCCCTAVNKVCASGAKAVTLAAQSITLGAADVVVAGGAESMSNAPYMLGGGGASRAVNPARNGGYRMTDAKLVDSVFRDGLSDSTPGAGGCAMGQHGDACARTYGITREEQDDYALRSYERAAKAYEAGKMQREVVPVGEPGSGGGGGVVVEEDEEFRRLRADKVRTLRPAFDREHGTLTAANSSSINDGAAALVLVSRRKARELGLDVRRAPRILQFADAELEPARFTVAPAHAIRKLKAWHAVEYLEVNEAFSVVPLAVMRELYHDADADAHHAPALNLYGGAVSLGHPIGCSGARIIVTLLNVMAIEGFRSGIAAVCNGGGGATALKVETE